MVSISPNELLLRGCLTGEPWTRQLLCDAMEEEDGRVFFRVVVETLGDRFDPQLCDIYAQLFSEVIEIANPTLRASDLVERYNRVRLIKRCRFANVSDVYVLSRVTLGADVAVTSIVLDGLKRRFPGANIHFVGSRKNFELFAPDPRIQHVDFTYPRAGTMADRLRSWPEFNSPNCLVVDPDSRLSQLGLLPVASEERYFFFESRGFGGESDAGLRTLTRRWVRETFEVDADSYVAPVYSGLEADIALSFGVGENPGKRIGDDFEFELVQALAATGKSLLIDEGAGGEESQRVQRLCERIPAARSWRGAYGPFANVISRAKFYAGYDSAGQHVAAAAGTPLLSIFAGYPSERFFHRWRPSGKGHINVVKVADRNPSAVLASALQNLTL